MCGKHSDISNIHYQSNRQGCLEVNSIIYGKSSVLEPRITITLQTQDIVHASGLPGVEIGGNDLKLLGKPNDYTHSTGQPLSADPTQDVNTNTAQSTPLDEDGGVNVNSIGKPDGNNNSTCESSSK